MHRMTMIQSVLHFHDENIQNLQLCHQKREFSLRTVGYEHGYFEARVAEGKNRFLSVSFFLCVV